MDARGPHASADREFDILDLDLLDQQDVNDVVS